MVGGMESRSLVGVLGLQCVLDIKMEMPTRQVDRQDWNQLEESTLQRHLQESPMHGWCSQSWDCLGSQGGEEGEEGEEGQRLKKENQQPRLTASLQ